MVNYDQNRNCIIYDELKKEDVEFWFDFKQKKFLHNIDTFYYSVKFKNDFTDSSDDSAVLKLRREFEKLKKAFNSSMGVNSVNYFLNETNLILMRGSFSYFYNIHLQSPDAFDIFIAPVVPRGADGDSVTCEVIVQLRSYYIWLYGIHEAFEMSYVFIKELAKKYNLEIAFIQENRCDYCWHTNYFLKPSSFFNSENFYKMRVSKYSEAFHHTFAVGSEGYEVDYLALGRRGSKCFIRIYHKLKEVIEPGKKEGYKGFFFKIWFFNGLINRYDLYCYEEAFKRSSFKYLNIARLKWYLEYGSDENIKERCRYCVDQFEEYGLVGDDLIALADMCTPKLNMIVNVEFQTMRKASKSFALIPFHAVTNKEMYKEAARIYDYLDNHAIICEYLTRKVLRFVSGDDSNKARRPDCPFWAALRRTKMFDVKKNYHDVKLVREYNRELNFEVAKKRAVNSVVRLGFYSKGNNKDSVGADLMDFINTLNDNDIKDAERYKGKQIKHLSRDFEKFEGSKNTSSEFIFVDSSDGSIYDRQTIDEYFNDLGDEENEPEYRTDP